jgi:hypothetical protein
MPLQRFLQESQSPGFITFLRDIALENLALVIDRAPKVVPLAVDLYEHFIKVPAPLAITLHPAHALATNVGSNKRAEPVPPQPHVSWQILIPRSNNRSSTLRKLSGNRTYIITTRRMISGDELKYRNGLSSLRGLGIAQPCRNPLITESGAVALTAPVGALH